MPKYQIPLKIYIAGLGFWNLEYWHFIVYTFGILDKYGNCHQPIL